MGGAQTRTARIELIESSIVVARIGEERQTLDDAQKNLQACARVAAPIRRPLLVDICQAQPLSAEVRHCYMGEHLSSFVALALVVRDTPLGRMMGNVYLRIARPGVPIRIFADEPAALAWLRPFAS